MKNIIQHCRIVLYISYIISNNSFILTTRNICYNIIIITHNNIVDILLDKHP